MALVQEMAVKIDQGFLGAILALFTPAADPQAERKKVEQSSRLMVELTDAHDKHVVAFLQMMNLQLETIIINSDIRLHMLGSIFQSAGSMANLRRGAHALH